ncbi:MAG: N-6 DNA methylase [Candidatus Bathyarchaeia archaeon]
MRGRSAQLIGGILSKLGLIEMPRPERAADLLSTALAVILKVSGRRSLEALEELQGFPVTGFRSLTRMEQCFLQEQVDSRIDGADKSTIAQLQEQVQAVVEPARRKRLAAYYTKPKGVALMAEIAELYLEVRRERRVTLADPFLGSGLTLTAAIQRIGESAVKSVWGVEPQPLSAIVAYAALLHSLGGDACRVNVQVGDAFTSLGFGSDVAGGGGEPLINADVVLTNPPFTRWDLLDGRYRESLRRAVVHSAYNRFLARKQLSLQLLAMFVIDRVLKESGLLVSVLPASTFYTVAGEAVKGLLRDKYTVHALVESLPEPSFSTDSGFKELILTATKRKPHRRRETAFITLGASSPIGLAARAAFSEIASAETIPLNRVNLRRLPGLWDMNWLVNFGHTPLREVVMEILKAGGKRGAIDSWASLFGDRGMVRGVEMYGPNFFFLPNDHWRLVEDNRDSILITESEGDRSLMIPRTSLVTALRKPGLYADKVSVEPQHYLLAVPPSEVKSLPADVVEYIDWGLRSGAAGPAVKAFGEHWYMHVYRQLEAKRPYGRVFLPDKVDPSFRHRGVFANYSPSPVTASKDFYITRSDNPEECKLLAAWFNSSILVALLLLVGRRISETWTRFLEEDYLKLPVVNLSRLSVSAKSSIRSAFERLLSMGTLPPLRDQFTREYRFELDAAFAEAFGLPELRLTVERLHAALMEHLDHKVP